MIYSRWAEVSESHVPQKKETKIQQTPDRTIETDSSADLSAVHQNLLIEGWLHKEEKQRGKASGVPKYTRIELTSVATSDGEMSPNLKLVAKIFKDGGQERYTALSVMVPLLHGILNTENYSSIPSHHTIWWKSLIGYGFTLHQLFSFNYTMANHNLP